MAKDKPRYKAIHEYEQQFKKSYIRGLSKSLVIVLKKIISTTK